MQEEHDLLKTLAVVLGAAGATSVISRLLRQPVVLGYIVAGVIVGPHLGLPFGADPVVVHTLSEVGVILLMFSLGLEFSLRKLARVGPGVAITAIIECSLLFWLGFAAGKLFGWTLIESLFAGAVIAISSTTIIAKAFAELRITGRLRELVVGVLIVEDLIAIVLMATLTAVATGAGLSALSMAKTTSRLALFLVGLVVLGLLVVPRITRRVAAMQRPEVTLVSCVGLCFAIALLARELGYSVALGAFLAGSIIAESGEELMIERLVRPVRDLFGAVFFVSVGMMMDPALMIEHWAAIAVFTCLVVFGKIVSVTLGAFVTGNGARTSIQAGLSLAQIGEFSFIIAGLGLALHATPEFFFPVVVAVSAITTLLTPWFIRHSTPAATWIDRLLPRPLQTFVALYGSWLERLRSAKPKSAGGVVVRRLLRRLLLDAVALAVIIIAGALGARPLLAYLDTFEWFSHPVARVLVMGVFALASAPFTVGVVRLGLQLAMKLAALALPLPSSSSGAAELDLAAASRRALTLMLQLGILLLVGLPLMAVTQPFLPGTQGATVLLAILFVLVLASWRSARNLEGHVRAAAQVLVELLARQSHAPEDHDAIVDAEGPLAAVLQGLGEPVVIDLLPDSPAVEHTLSDLNLRGVSGATVLLIRRGQTSILVPSADERLHAGDTLAIAGSREAVATARKILVGPDAQPAVP